MLKQNNNLILEDNNSASASDIVVHATSDNNNKSQYLHPPPTQSQPLLKKKRNLPGNPDPEAEVISLSPKTLMATNRFVCEVCNKGFQRDQNLQLHRRGHNLPWKLKQRNKNEVVRKKVYVCPEVNCVHHEPSRALGDLTGIKKHFSRKHGEKKWKCDKCSKRYAVQSDWKAHSKTCGTKEYKCDCGTLFSRRDSFITHRAFCDALAEESARTITGGGIDPSIIPGQVTTHFSDIHFLDPTFLKKEDHQNSPLFPSWLLKQNNNNNNNSQSQECSGPNVIGYHPTVPSSAYMSATALLQKAAQMGTTHLSKNSTSLQAPCTTSSSSMIIPQPQYQTAHVSVGNNNGGTTTTTLSTSSLTNHEGFADVSLSPAFQHHHLSMTMMMMNNSFADVSTFEDEFSHHLLEEKVDKGMTRDFLGLKPQSSTHQQPWHIDMQGN